MLEMNQSVVNISR